jgi:Uma2 family endonuclease
MNAPVRPADLAPAPVTLTAAAMRALAETGFFEQDPNRYELVEGTIIMTPPPGVEHSFVEERLVRALFAALTKAGLSEDYSIHSGGGIAVSDDSLLAPDLVISQVRREPRPLEPSDLALLIEIAWSSRAFDLGKKASLYATAGIGEYWVVDIPARCVIVHRAPDAGAYTRVAPVAAGEQLVPASLPQLSVAVSDFF